MGRKRICVVGFYGKQNLGDEAFKAAFKELWPQVDFTFSDHSPTGKYDAVWVGGGSFLDQEVKNLDKITLPLAFVGVGIGKFVHPKNEELLKRALAVVTRDQASGHISVADLVYARTLKSQAVPEKKITILLNDHFSPKEANAEWQLLSHYWFSQEFSQICDQLALDGFKLVFLPMSTNPHVDDRRAAATVLGRMKRPQRATWITQDKLTEQEFIDHLASSHMVITQRLHGAIFSSILKVPFLCINAHDKMAALAAELKWGGIVDYYGLTKRSFWKAFLTAQVQPVPELYIKEASDKWRAISVMMAERFSL